MIFKVIGPKLWPRYVTLSSFFPWSLKYVRFSKKSCQVRERIKGRHLQIVFTVFFLFNLGDEKRRSLKSQVRQDNYIYLKLTAESWSCIRRKSDTDLSLVPIKWMPVKQSTSGLVLSPLSSCASSLCTKLHSHNFCVFEWKALESSDQT